MTASKPSSLRGGSPSAPSSPHPTMRFQKNLMLQKHQADMEEQREEWERKYRPVYEAVNKEFDCAKQWHDPLALSLNRLKAPSHLSSLLPSHLSDTEAFHHHRLRASSHLHAGLTGMGGPGTVAGTGMVPMVRSRSSGGPPSVTASSAATLSTSSTSTTPHHHQHQQHQQHHPPVRPTPLRASTVRGLSALWRGSGSSGGQPTSGAAQSH
ncbi:hypothetical protein HKX48_002303 [Thoreauomyces humboldtii]|nr:hypothetical protein HKX48_002303 [Thoreauomyces humboldtii]